MGLCRCVGGADYVATALAWVLYLLLVLGVWLVVRLRVY